jgi:hypothetical protein
MPRVARIIAPTNRIDSDRAPPRVRQVSQADHGSRRRQHKVILALPAALVVARRDLHRPTTPWANYRLYLVHRPRFSRPSSIRCGAPMARASRLPATSSLVLSRTLGICPQPDASQIVTPQRTSAATSARPGILRLDPVGLGRLRYCPPYSATAGRIRGEAAPACTTTAHGPRRQAHYRPADANEAL